MQAKLTPDGINHRVWVVSVENSGTHTLHHFLLRSGGIMHANALNRSKNRRDFFNEKIVFVPLRHPYDVWDSWTKRMPPEADPAYEFQKTYDDKARRFLLQWNNLDWFIKEFSPHLVPIDLLTNNQLVVDGASKKESKIDIYPWRPEFDVIYEMPFVKQHYAPRT